jgi:hypothetical protein
MKKVGHFMTFPGWDLSSMHYVLQNPAKSAIAPAILTLFANQIISHAGKQSDPENAYDPFATHYGNHSITSSLLREPMAIHLVRPLWIAAQAAAQGQPVLNAGVNQAFKEGFNLIRPDISGLVALTSAAAGMHFPGAPAFTERDKQTPSKILPFTNKAVEKTLAQTILRANPWGNKLADGDTSHLEEKLRMYSDALHGDKDARRQVAADGFYDATHLAGSMVGVYDYRRDTEQTLRLRSSMGQMYQKNYEALIKSDPKQAMRWASDPTIAAYLLFHKDFSKMSSDLGKLNDMYDNAKTNDERKAIESARKGLLANSELENNVFLGAESRKSVEKAKAATGVQKSSTTNTAPPNLIDAAFASAGQPEAYKKADLDSQPPSASPAFRLSQQLLRRQR